jgi:hypothetical protein
MVLMHGMSSAGGSPYLPVTFTSTGTGRCDNGTTTPCNRLEPVTGGTTTLTDNPNRYSCAATRRGGNAALFEMWTRTSGKNMYGAKYVIDAAKLWLADQCPPALDRVATKLGQDSFSADPPGWMSDPAGATIGVFATDRGLGVKQVRMWVPQPDGGEAELTPVTMTCTFAGGAPFGTPCPREPAPPEFALGTAGDSIPEGATAARVQITDATARSSDGTWAVRSTRPSRPRRSEGGSMTRAGDRRIPRF